MAREIVHTIAEYYDGPVEGVADFGGRPHVYRRQIDRETDEFTDDYWLMEIDRETLELAVEKDEIHNRWAFAFQRGEASRGELLPGDRSRYAELTVEIGDRLVLDRSRAVTVRGKMLAGSPLMVEWETEPASEPGR